MYYLLNLFRLLAHLATHGGSPRRRNQGLTKKLAKGLVFQSESGPKPIDKDEEDEDAALIEGLPASTSSTSGM